MFESGYAIGVDKFSTDIGFLTKLKSDKIHVDILHGFLYVTTQTLEDLELFYSKLETYCNSKMKISPRLTQVLISTRNLIKKEKEKLYET